MSLSRAGRGCWLMLAVALSAAGSSAPATDWKAGAASVAITPDEPIWLAGYASRNRPSDGKAQDIYARALALEDGSARRVVIVSIETLGLTAALAESIAASVQQEHRVPPDRLFLISTHTHTAPVIDGALRGAYELDQVQTARVKAYTRTLQDKVVAAVARALAALAPARLTFTTTSASFGVNRRVPGERGFTIGVNPDGPADPEVPILRVESPDGRVRGIVFGYACHNTTLTGDSYQVSGDYAGFAAAELERAFPQSVALFVTGAGADINPHPRGTVEHAQAHGRTLARAIEDASRGTPTPIRGRIITGTRTLDLALAVPRQDELRSRLADENAHRRRHAERMLARMTAGTLMTAVPYRVGALQLGDRFTLIALPGEVVVDYARRLKRESDGGALWIAAYAHDVPAYIPSERILREGGYEADASMIYYDQAGPLAPGLEDRIVAAVRDLRSALRASER